MTIGDVLSALALVHVERMVVNEDEHLPRRRRTDALVLGTGVTLELIESSLDRVAILATKDERFLKRTINH